MVADRTTKVTLTAQVNNYVQGFQKAQHATESAAKASEDAAAAFEKQNQAMSSVGRHLLAAGAVATAATALAVKAAIDWESAWAGVTKTVDGTPEQLAAVEQGLRDLTGVLPASHTEIAAVAEAAGQLGVQTGNVVAFTRTMIDLGETTNLSANDAATSLARFMNVMGTAQSDVSNLGSAVVELGNNYATTEAEIVAMAQRLSGAGRQIGLSEGEVLGLATALSSVGIEAEAGGSAISKVMIDIASSVDAGGERVKLFADVAGVSVKEFSDRWRKDAGGALALFVAGLANAEAQGESTFGVLEQLGITEIRMRDALLRSAAASDQFTAAMQMGNAAFKENNALAEEAEKRYATVESQLGIMANKVNDAAIDFGDVFLPAVSAVATAVGALADGFGALPAPIQAVIGVTVALAGAVALAGGAFLVAVPNIAQFNAALAVLRTSQIPGVAAAVATATAGVGRMTAALGGALRFLTGPWGLGLAAAAVGVSALAQAMENLQASAEEMENAAVTARDAEKILTKAFQGIASGFVWEDGANAIKNFGENLRQIGDYQKNFLTGFTMSFDAGALRTALKNVDEALGPLAQTSAPDAARAFQLLAEKTDGSREQLMILLNELPAYKAALTDQATAAGKTASDQTLLNLAMKEAEPPASAAADAYRAAADEADALAGEVMSLVDAVNAANGVGQDAVTTNARYQEALAGISEEVARQREEYEAAHGTLDGFVLSLDQSTAAGSSNAAMLADVAGAAQTAAAAQYEQDLATMSAKDATDKYAATLAAQRQAFVDAAVAAGYNKDEVGLLADQIFALPSEKEVEVLVDTAQAEADLDWFTRSRTVTIKTSVEGGFPNHFASRTGFAEGGRLPGPPSKRDNMLIHAASGEFVVNADATQKNLGLLEYLNAGGKIRGFADGGFVQPQYATSMSGSQVVVRPNLDGMAISGSLDLGNGLTGLVEGVLHQHDRAQARAGRGRMSPR